MSCAVYFSPALFGIFALAVAEMQLPDDFHTAATKISVSGFGGKNKGSYAFAGHSGEFTRSESRLGIFDPLYVSSKGKSTFSFREDGAAHTVSAECGMKKGSVTLGIITFDPKKMSYECDFRQGTQLLGARFILGQPKAAGFKEALLAKDLRAGEAIIFNQHLTMQSVHSYKGTKLRSPSPVGYLVQSAGKTIAAVELTDINPTFFVATDIDAELRRSVLIAGLA
ncbi:MAG: hypothetical protein KJO82_07380, partial [Gammaproteobacteria bacterium]|nr:hypothetical protein [Gammaproteobacteria bacterium]